MILHLPLNPSLVVAIRITRWVRLIGLAVFRANARWKIVEHQCSPPLGICTIFGGCRAICEILYPSQGIEQHHKRADRRQKPQLSVSSTFAVTLFSHSPFADRLLRTGGYDNVTPNRRVSVRLTLPTGRLSYCSISRPYITEERSMRLSPTSGCIRIDGKLIQIRDSSPRIR